jgi:hypothetical protein
LTSPITFYHRHGFFIERYHSHFSGMSLVLVLRLMRVLQISF